MKPGKHKTVQSRTLKYAQEIGWIFVSRAEAEARRGLKEWELSSLMRAHLGDYEWMEVQLRFAVEK